MFIHIYTCKRIYPVLKLFLAVVPAADPIPMHILNEVCININIITINYIESLIRRNVCYTG